MQRIATLGQSRVTNISEKRRIEALLTILHEVCKGLDLESQQQEGQHELAQFTVPIAARAKRWDLYTTIRLEASRRT